ncbi:MAG TPA: phage tail protein [Phyllobacterium sp.]|nr:phage tail protein [Phyllobacterium sp.]
MAEGSFDGTDNCWKPDLPIGANKKQRLKIAKYGDGYEQRMTDGINYIETEYDLSWATRDESVIVAMDEYLSSRAARAFPFEHPVTKQIVNVFCDEWSISWTFKHKPAGAPDRITYGTLTATFRIANGEAVV